jgi:hypothetical protein
MSILDTTFRTITCNGPNCKKSVTFEPPRNNQVPPKTGEIFAAPENSWLNTTFRTLQASDGRNFCYCSDTCEVEAAGTGVHNRPEPKKIVEMPAAGSAEFVRLAAEAAKAREQADKDLRNGPTQS